MISIAYLIGAVRGPPESLSSSAKASRYNSQQQQAKASVTPPLLSLIYSTPSQSLKLDVTFRCKIESLKRQP